MANVAINFTSDEKAAVDAIMKVVAASRKQEEGLGAIVRKSREAAAAEREMGREAKQVLESLQSPLDRHNADLTRLQKLYDANKLTVGQYSRAVQQATEHYRANSQATKATEQAARGAAAAEVRFAQAQALANQQMLELTRSAEAGRASMRGFGAAAHDGERAIRSVGAAAAVSFGSKAVQDLLAYGGAFLTVSSAINFVKQRLDELDERAKKAAEGAKRERMPMGALAQVAASPKEFRELRDAAEGLYARGGAESEEAAAATVFAAKSAGLMGELPFIGDLRRSGLIAQPGEMVRSAVTLRTAMGARETGNLRSIISKALGAAAGGPTRAEPLLEAAATAGTGARILGITDEQLLASTMVLANATGQAERAGTQMNALMRSLQRIGAGKVGGEEGEEEQDIATAFAGLPAAVGARGLPAIKFDFAGKNLKQMLKQISQQTRTAGFTNADLLKLFGRGEAVNAYRILMANEAMYETGLERTTRAGAMDEVGRRMAFAANDVEMEAARRAEEARARSELAGKPVGTWYNFSEELIEEDQQRLRKAGVGRFSRWLDEVSERNKRWIWGPEWYVRGKAGTLASSMEEFMDTGQWPLWGPSRNTPPPPPPPPPPSSSGGGSPQADAARALESAATKLENASRNLSGGVTMGVPPAPKKFQGIYVQPEDYPQ